MDRWVFIGTGRLLHENDLPSVQQQTMYGIRDGSYDTAEPDRRGAAHPRHADAVTGVAGLGAGVIAPKGWYDDLPANHRLIRRRPRRSASSGTWPPVSPTDPCEPGQPATVYARPFGNGESVLDTGGRTRRRIGHHRTGGASFNIVAVHQPGCSDCSPTSAG